MSPWQMEPWNAVPSTKPGPCGLPVGFVARMVPSHQRRGIGRVEASDGSIGPSFSSTLGGLRLRCWAMASWQVLELFQKHKLRNWNDWFKRHWNIGKNFEWNGRNYHLNSTTVTTLKVFYGSHGSSNRKKSGKRALVPSAMGKRGAQKATSLGGRVSQLNQCWLLQEIYYLVSRGLWTKPVQEISPFLNQCKAIDVLGLNLPKSTHHFRLVLLLCVILQPGKSLECLSTWFPWYGAAPLDSTKASSTPLNLKPFRALLQLAGVRRAGHEGHENWGGRVFFWSAPGSFFFFFRKVVVIDMSNL